MVMATQPSTPPKSAARIAKSPGKPSSGSCDWAASRTPKHPPTRDPDHVVTMFEQSAALCNRNFFSLDSVFLRHIPARRGIRRRRGPRGHGRTPTPARPFAVTRATQNIHGNRTLITIRTPRRPRRRTAARSGRPARSTAGGARPRPDPSPIRFSIIDARGRARDRPPCTERTPRRHHGVPPGCTRPATGQSTAAAPRATHSAGA